MVNLLKVYGKLSTTQNLLIHSVRAFCSDYLKPRVMNAFHAQPNQSKHSEFPWKHSLIMIICSDTVIHIWHSLHFRSSAGSRVGQNSSGEEQGVGDVFETSTVSHRWSEPGNWGKNYRYEVNV